MFPAALSDRLDAMIDDLIMDGGVETASLASILVAAKDSLNRDSLVTLSRRVWAASNELRSVQDEDEPGPVGPDHGPPVVLPERRPRR